jgi:hypothetical protein
LRHLITRATLLAAMAASAVALVAGGVADARGGGGGTSVRLTASLVASSEFPRASAKSRYDDAGTRSMNNEIINTGLPEGSNVHLYFNGTLLSAGSYILSATSRYPTGTFYNPDTARGYFVPVVKPGDTIEWRTPDGRPIASGSFKP